MATIIPKYLTEDVLNYFAQWAKENLETFTPEDYAEAMLLLHPIGSYYWSEKPTNPRELFGGTWVPVSDCYMYATNNTGMGGSSTVTLTSAHMPSHSHTFNGSHTHSIKSHTHSIAKHSHTIPSSSHNHTLSHSHPSVTKLTARSYTVNNADIGPGRNIFQKIYNPGVNYPPTGPQPATTTVDLKTNTTATTTDQASATVSLDSGGGGTSGSANTTTTGSNSGSNYTFNLDPPYINAYCWYRSG